MSIGTVTLLCAGLVLGQAANEPFHVNTRSISIPLSYEEALRADLQQVMIYCSINKGALWQLKAAVTPDQKDFPFRATNDGEYWLQVASVNKQGKQTPQDINKTEDKHIQKFVIDTFKPLINITQAQRQGDEILVAWEIQEENPKLSTFKLEYQVAPSAPWTAAPVPAGLVGKGKFRPGSMGAIALRLQLHDHAGNATLATAEVKSAPGVTLAQETPTPAAIPPANATPLAMPPALTSDTLAPPPVAPVAPEIPRETVRAMAPPPPVERQLPPALPPTMQPAPPPVTRAWEAAPGAAPPRYDVNTKLVASSDDPAPRPVPVAPVGPARKLPALQFVNSPEVTLEYELSKVGPSGVGSVDLWWTQNDGQTWEKYAFDPEAKGPGRHQRVVELPTDGVFGFQLVVKSRAGLGKREPRPGDAPEIRIEVDTVPPIAQLFAPVPDTQRANSLILSWSAKDNNLTTHPITLEWSERREGPWQPIVANQPNTGKYSWQLPDTLPVQVHLRLRARDCAGNEGVAVTPEPQLVDLSEPEGRLVNVSVPPRR